MKKILFYAAAIAAMTACSDAAVETTIAPEVEGGNLVTIIASTGVDSKVAVDDNWVATWEEGDAMVAIYTNGNAEKFTLTSGAGSTSGSFTGTENNSCYFVYPYSLVEGRAGVEDMDFPLDLTAQQSGLNYNYMVSTEAIDTSADNPTLSMEHVGAAMVLNITGLTTYDEATIQSVTVSGLNSVGTLDTNDGSLDDLTTSTITITDCGAISSQGAATIKFNILPTTIEANDTITVTAYLELSDNTVAALSQTLTATSGVVFDAGKYHTINCSGLATISTLWSDYADNSFDVAVANYEISTAEQFAKFAANVNSGTSYSGIYFKLTADIDLSAHEWVAISSGFKGIFDGDNHKITGLYINQPESNTQGLFGYINGATIKNLSVSGYVVGKERVGGVVANSSSSSDIITNCSNSCSVVGNGSNIGGVVGYASGAVTNCYNSGSVESLGYADSTTSNLNVGGVVGSASGAVTNCYNSGDVENSGTSSSISVGGLVGSATDAVTNCYNSGGVVNSGTSSSIYVGGLVGSATAAVTNCYNSGGVENSGTSSSNIGSLVGCVDNHSMIVYCYWLDGTYTAAGSYADGATKYTTTQMTNGTLLGDLNDYAKDTLNADTDTACKWVEGTDSYPTLSFGVYE